MSDESNQTGKDGTGLSPHGTKGHGNQKTSASGTTQTGQGDNLKPTPVAQKETESDSQRQVKFIMKYTACLCMSSRQQFLKLLCSLKPPVKPVKGNDGTRFLLDRFTPLNLDIISKWIRNYLDTALSMEGLDLWAEYVKKRYAIE
tara:strand:- start:250 stop:684 length:435 start_codon:yes stop_codon:yes gene_type:complete